MRPFQRLRLSDAVCPECYHRMDIIKRVKRHNFQDGTSTWMLIRKCPQCGIQTLHKDTDQSDGGKKS